MRGYIVVFLPVVLYSGALALGEIFDIPSMFGGNATLSLWVTVWAIGLIGAIYAVFGGLKAVVVSDTINAVGLFTGGLLVPIFGLMYIGDGSITDGASTLWTENREKFNPLGEPGGLLPWQVLFTGLIFNQLFYWGTNQAIVQRAFAAKNLREGQKGLMIAAVFKILVPFIVVLPGIIAFHIFGEDLSTADDAYPALVDEVLPRWLLGFFAAVLFGAILSSFNSVLNSCVTLFGVDIYRQQFNADATDEDVTRVGKRVGTGLALLSMTVAPFIANAPDGLYNLLNELNGAYSVPILSVVLMGYFSRYVPAIGAKIALIAGTCLYLISQFVVAPMVGENYPHFLHILAVIFFINVTIMWISRKMAPRAEPYGLAESGAVDMVAWKWTPIACAAVAIAVVAVYAVLAVTSTGANP